MPEREKLYSPVPKAQPTDRPTPYIHEEFAPVHFDQSIGDALKHLGHAGYGVLGESTKQVGAAMASLGKSFEHAGDEIFARASAIKHIENQTAAVEADTMFRISGNKMTEAYEQQQGEAASGALDAHMANLEKERQKVRGSLQNDEVRNMFDQRSLPALGGMVMRAGHHAKGQGRVAAIGARDANFKMRLDDLMKEAATTEFDVNQIAKRRDALMEEFNAQLDLEGIDRKGPQGKLRIREKVSNINSAIIAGIGNRDPQQAMRLLDEWLKTEGNFTAEDAIKLKNGLLTKNTTTALRVETDKELSFLDKPPDDKTPEPTLAELEQKILKFIEKDPILSQDPNAKERGIANMRAVWGLKQQIRIEKERKETSEINNAVYGVRNPQLPRPTSMAEFYAQNPDLKPILESNGKKLAEVEGMIARNNNKDDFGPTPARKERYLEILGWFNHKDTLEKAMFLDIDKEQLPFEYRKHILEVRRGFSGVKARDDPRTTTWMGWLTTEHIIPDDVNKTKNPKKYYAYTGFVANMAREFERETGKHIGWEELKAIGRKAKEEIQGPEGESFWYNIGMAKRTRFFEVPAKFRAAVQADNANATEDEIVEAYGKAYMSRYAPVLYLELYGKPMPPKVPTVR